MLAVPYEAPTAGRITAPLTGDPSEFCTFTVRVTVAGRMMFHGVPAEVASNVALKARGMFGGGAMVELSELPLTRTKTSPAFACVVKAPVAVVSGLVESA